MLVVSPKWIYSNNSKLEKDKSILIDGPIILDILDNESIEKKYKEVSRICLLYTSPSPRDVEESRMPSSA